MKQSLSMALALIGSASLAKAYEALEKDLPLEVKSTLLKMIERQCSDWLESVEIRKTK